MLFWTGQLFGEVQIFSNYRPSWKRLWKLARYSLQTDFKIVYTDIQEKYLGKFIHLINNRAIKRLANCI